MIINFRYLKACYIYFYYIHKHNNYLNILLRTYISTKNNKTKEFRIQYALKNNSNFIKDSKI